MCCSLLQGAGLALLSIIIIIIIINAHLTEKIASVCNSHQSLTCSQFHAGWRSSSNQSNFPRNVLNWYMSRAELMFYLHSNQISIQDIYCQCLRTTNKSWGDLLNSQFTCDWSKVIVQFWPFVVYNQVKFWILVFLHLQITPILNDCVKQRFIIIKLNFAFIFPFQSPHKSWASSIKTNFRGRFPKNLNSISCMWICQHDVKPRYHIKCKSYFMFCIQKYVTNIA